ncbi:lysostaphin resistance A-like protein [Terrabacter koreensis]
MTTTIHTRHRQSRLHQLIQRRPITMFLILGVGAVYLLATVWGLAYHGVIPGGGLHETLGVAPDEVAGFLFILGLLPVALYVTWVVDGRRGVRSLLRRAFRWRVSVGWWLTVLLAIPVITVGLAAVLGDSLRPVDLIPLVASQIGLLLVNFVLVNLWEETVWTGFMQTRLERRHNWYLSGIITAVPFALVHLPLEFFLDQTVDLSVLLGAFVTYFILGVLVRPACGVLRRGTGDSLLLVALFHSIFNRTNNDNGIAAEMVNGELRALTMIVAVVLVTIGVAVAARGRLSKTYAVELERRATAAAS